MKENNKFDIVSKMTIIGVVAAVIIIVTIVIVLIAGKEDKNNAEIGDSDNEIGTIIIDPEEDETTSDLREEEYDRALAVVKYVDITENQLMIYDIEKLKTVTLMMDSSIDIKDEYGSDIALAQVELGDMVETKYEVTTMKPESVKITAKTWERKDVSNMVVDRDAKTISIANETYSYTDELITSDGGVPFDILELSVADEAVVRGYKGEVWSIVLLNGHGTLVLTNYSAFIGGNLEIGNRVNMVIEEDMSVPISAGIQNIVISKEGMAPFVTQIMVEENKEVIVDLIEAQPKVGIVEFVLLQEDVSVYINDELVDLSQEVKLDFDTYAIRAEKEGYSPWESELILNQAYTQYKIDLEKTASFLRIQQPEGAEAYLDGVSIGIVPTDTPYQAGTHKLVFRKDGYHTFSQDFYWDNNEIDRYIAVEALTPLAEVTIPSEDDEGKEVEIYVEP